MIRTWLGWLLGGAVVSRTPEQQARVEAEVEHLTLYQLPGCPFCATVRRALRRLGLAIETRNISSQARYREELRAGGGETQVPCLRIREPDGSVRWLYESADIVAYLRRRFDPVGRPG